MRIGTWLLVPKGCTPMVIDKNIAYQTRILIFRCDTSNVHEDCCAERRLIVTKLACTRPGAGIVQFCTDDSVPMCDSFGNVQ
jgi:hypothetical protein